jgi:hypothetical protein
MLDALAPCCAIAELAKTAKAKNASSLINAPSLRRRESYRTRGSGTLIAVKRTLAAPDPIFVLIFHIGGCMNFKSLLVVAVTAAFALPVAAQQSADSDRMILAQAGTSAVGNGPTGGAPSPQSAGEPKAPMAGERPAAGASSSGATASTRGRPDFSAIDKNGDGQISRAEWDAFYRDRDRGAASGGATTAPSGATAAPAARGKTGTTAGPGEASPRAAPSSDTATSGSSSGTGKAGSQ